MDSIERLGRFLCDDGVCETSRVGPWRVVGESRGRIVVVCGASGHPSVAFLILPRPPGVAGRRFGDRVVGLLFAMLEQAF